MSDPWVRKIPSVFGKSWRISRYEIVWWGWSQWYKWRWNGTHIDFGVVSIYGLKETGLERLFWVVVAFAIYPMRFTYHHFFVSEEFKESE